MHKGHLMISSGIVDETEFVTTVECISSHLAATFRFGYYTYQDIKQESYILALHALDKWDRKRSLYTFLYTHVRNRLCNIKRDKYERRNPPCENCPISAYCSTSGCLAYDDMRDCPWYHRWLLRNESKKSLMSPSNIDNVYLDSKHGKSHNKEVETSDYLDWAESKLDSDDLAIFKQMRKGDKVLDVDQQRVLARVRECQEKEAP
jgi:DNA-directed RNA polymerase specialized sigma24 family protein